jgi:hypothetical protein
VQPQCWWEALRVTGGDASLPVTKFYVNGQRVAGSLFDLGGRQYVVDDATLTTYLHQVRRCTDTTRPQSRQRRWAVTTPPDPAILIPALYQRVVRRVPVPEPNVDPAPEVLVHVGLWIAVANSADVVAHAEPAPGVWAETRATLTSTTFDPGNGAQPVTCAGAGTPIPPGMDDDPREGPCGYTYTTVADLGDRAATITTTWTVTATTSTGHRENRDPITLRVALPLHVYEIQTVGSG